MKAEIITIGDEILIGQIVDTNSVFIAKELNKIGVSVYQISSIQDEKEHIINALKEAESRADIIIITGGLGPTKDDITKHTLCDYFNDVLVENTSVLENIKELFKNKEFKTITETNRQQALVPSKSIVLENNLGTAPGMYFNKGKKVFVSLPGVPYEMKGLMINHVIPRVLSEFELPFIYHKTIITEGIPESILADKISEWEEKLPSFIKLAYLPNLGVVRLRLSAKGFNKDTIITSVKDEIKTLMSLIGDAVIGFDEDSPEKIVANMLICKGETLSLAESCTGGLITSNFVNIEGASSFLKGGIIPYHTTAKEILLQIDKEIVSKHSVVSNEVAKQMAISVKQKFNTDYAIATTGNAGPKKGDSSAELGDVYIAIATPNEVIVEKYNFGNNRYKVIQRAKNKALQLLRLALEEVN